MERMSARGRVIRVAVTLVVVVLTFAGTLVGDDFDFPFAPFQMFAIADSPNAPVMVLRSDGIDTTGKRIVLDERNAGVRRAEIEAQIDRFKADPSLLRSV